MRGGFEQDLTPAQARFSDPSVDLIVRDVESLQHQFKDDATVGIAMGAHSIRAVPIESVVELANYAEAFKMPFHVHVCEQRREIEESLAEHNTTPIALLNDHGVLSPRFVGVHATHLTDEEIQMLGNAKSFVCICRTTERDLGDGLPPMSDLINAGARLCVGVDSHACENAFEEIRAVEFDERSRLEARHTVAEAPALLDAASQLGYSALGLTRNQEDQVWLDADDASLAGADEDSIADSVIFAATPRSVRKVFVAGRQIVDDGIHRDYESALHNYQRTLKRLLR
jgi:formiminoglutamate deiminase